MNTSKLLISESPIQLLPSLAVALGGVNEAIVLQQLHYWVSRSNNVKDGRQWVYNSIREWAAQFPFWSEDTIKRTMRTLRDKGVVLTANYNELKVDRTLWYTIDYDALNALVQDASPIGADCPSAKVQVATTNNQENTTENTTRDVVVVVGDDDPALGEVFQLWQDNMPGSLTSLVSDSVKDLCSSYGASEVAFAIREAVKSNARNLRYIQAILVNRAAGREKPTPANVGPVGGGRWVPAQKQTNVDRSMAAVDAVFARFENGGAL